MAVIYVARSAKLGKWASDVGLSKHVFKVGVAEEPLKPLLAEGWAGETDWAVIGKAPVEGLDEAAVIQRLQRKLKMVDPGLYPRLKGVQGFFKVLPAHVESHILVTRALAGDHQRGELKLKPADFADYLIHNALR